MKTTVFMAIIAVLLVAVAPMVSAERTYNISDSSTICGEVIFISEDGAILSTGPRCDIGPMPLVTREPQMYSDDWIISLFNPLIEWITGEI